MEPKHLHPARRKDYLTIRGSQQSSSGGGKDRLLPLKFPTTRLALWDHKSTGAPCTLHLCYHRHPVLVLEEQPLRLAQRLAQSQSSSTYKCALQGSLSVDPDAEGVCVMLDRLDTSPGGLRIPDSLEDLIPGEVVLYTAVKKNSVRGDQAVAKDYEQDIKLLHQRCVSKSKVDLSHFITMRASCSYHSNQQNHIFYIDLDLVTPQVTLNVTPVNAVPVVPTALSKNLSGPLSMSEVQGEPKSGYLTMDHTRKLLLVLESDPKVTSLPLVGIWVSGVATVQDPIVWASGLRYLYNNSLQDRVCLPPEPFLMVIYSTLHSKPEFYECKPSSEATNLTFSLYSCHEVVHLPKEGPPRPASPLELEFSRVESGSKRDVFEGALENCKSILCQPGETAAIKGTLAGALEEIVPRASPAPHHTKAPTIQPSVPEVSLLFDENTGSHSPSHYGRAGKTSESSRKKSSEPIRGPLRTVNGAPTPSSGTKMRPGKVTVTDTNGVSSPVPVTSTQPSPAPPLLQGYYGSMPGQGYVVNGSYGCSVGGGPVAGYSAAGPWAVPGYQPGHAPYPVVAAPMVYPGYGGPTPQGWMPPMPPQRPGSRAGAPHFPPRPYAAYPVPQPAAPHPSRPAANMPSPHMYEASLPRPSATTPHMVARPQVRPQPPGPVHPTSSMQPIPPQSAVVVSTNQTEHPKRHAIPPHSVSVSQPPLTPLTSQQSQPSPVPLPSDTIPSFSTSGGLSTSTKEKPPDAVYELLRKQDEQLQLLRGQLQELLQKQQAEGSQMNVTCQSQPSNVTGDHTLQSPASSPKASSGTGTQPHHSSHSAMPHTAGSTNNTCDTACGSDTPLGTPRRSSNKLEDPHKSPEHLPVGAAPQMTSSPYNVTEQAAAAGNSPGQGTDFGATMSSDTLSLGEFQLTQIQDRTEESIVSDMIVDMPDYGSLSPEKTSLQMPGGFNDPERSPVLGESVSMYQDQVVQMPGFEGAQGEESADTGLGDSHPDMALLFQNQKLFYDNLIGNVKQFLARHDESALEDSEATIQHGMSLQHPPPHHEPQQLNNTDPILSRRGSHNDVLDSSRNGSHNQHWTNHPCVRGEDNGHDSPVSSYSPVHRNSHPGALPPHAATHGNPPEMSPHHEASHLNSDMHIQSHKHSPPGHRNLRSPVTQEMINNRPAPEQSSTMGRPFPDKNTRPVPSFGSPQKHVQSRHEDLHDSGTAELDHDPELDIAEQTRQQLAKMGISLEELVSSDLKSSQPSVYFDANLLPKIQYVSMLLDGDSDMSADADALAMKYLSDEQLTELVKLRQTSGKSSQPQRDAALDRLLGTPNVSTYGMSANHMSFATKKYMERYGLVDEKGGQMKSPHSPVTPQFSQADTAAMNVRQFLKTLAERSFMNTPEHITPNKDTGTQRRTEYHKQPAHMDAPNMCNNCSRCSCSREMELGASYDGSYREYCQSPGHRQTSVHSDTTMYRTPDDSPLHNRQPNQAGISGIQKAASDHTPVKVFDQDFVARLRERRLNPEQGQFAPTHEHNRLSNSPAHATPQQGNRILDIQRLKELPKLL